ncbi:MAG: ribulose-phosphate 3-epimerase [Phycisphaerales bacterium]|nr:ribulose-phosphate 3-epimerase [Phycisphaerales bacterium]
MPRDRSTPPLIAPSILSADFAAMGEECRGVLEHADAAGRADLLHLDVMDGHFAPNLTMGPDMCRALRRVFPAAFLDVHLMVHDPAMFIERFADAGANNLTFHIEAVDEVQVGPMADKIRSIGASAGLAINPPTPVERVMPHLEKIDMLLVMSVNPGYSGQAFIPEVLEKVRAVRKKLKPIQRVQMDGGINVGNAGAVREAGCGCIVAASAVFGVPALQRPGVIRALRGL